MSLKLPRFEQGTPLVDENGLPTMTFHRWWASVADALEQAFNDLAASVAAIAAAQASADAAQATADAVKITDKIGGSSVIPANVLAATDAGTDATITVASNTRLYNDGTTLAVAGATFTGLAYSTTYAVYYDDITCSDTTPTYAITTTLSNGLNNFIDGRHSVGYIATPASGGGAVSGGYTPPGTDPGDKHQYSTL